MKKYFVLSLIVLIATMPDASYAKWRIGKYEECFVYNRDQFYYCGNQSGRSCSGIKEHLGDDGWQFWYGDTKELNGGKLYACCGDSETGGAENAGKWKIAVEPTREVVVHTITEGTYAGQKCSYTKETNACGKEISTACTEPSDLCADGKTMRNDVCVEPCPTGQGYESTASNTCVACPTTAHGGVHKSDSSQYSGVCIKCHETAQLFNYKTGECIDKSDTTKIPKQYSQAAFQKCWQCGTQEEFNTCVGLFVGKNPNIGEWSDSVPESCKG